MEDANFEDLLIKDSSWTIHEKKYSHFVNRDLNHISPPIMQGFSFRFKSYSLNSNLLRLFKTNTSRYGTEVLKQV